MRLPPQQRHSVQTWLLGPTAASCSDLQHATPLPCMPALTGSTSDIKWSNVKVGQVLKVLSDEDIPADLLCLYCHLDDNVCYIKTTNLDGALFLVVTDPPKRCQGRTRHPF